MKTPQKILIPTDFSQRANNALIQAIHLAERINGELLIFHTYHRPIREADPESVLTRLKKNIDVEFAGLENRIPELKNVPHTFLKEIGISVDKIIEVVTKESVDLIVMATGGAQSFDELWGTKTAKIIKQAEVPVIVIPDGTDMKEISKICLTCDYSQSSDFKELDFLVDLTRKLDLNIDVITLNRNERNMTHQELDNREMLLKKFEKIKSSFLFTHNPKIEEGIIEYSKSNDIGLIAILPKSYSFIERLFHESLTEKMTFHSPIPLLVLK